MYKHQDGAPRLEPQALANAVALAVPVLVICSLRELYAAPHVTAGLLG
jgi:hypothetical protein